MGMAGKDTVFRPVVLLREGGTNVKLACLKQSARKRHLNQSAGGLRSSLARERQQDQSAEVLAALELDSFGDNFRVVAGGYAPTARVF